MWARGRGTPTPSTPRTLALEERSRPRHHDASHAVSFNRYCFSYSEVKAVRLLLSYQPNAAVRPRPFLLCRRRVAADQVSAPPALPSSLPLCFHRFECKQVERQYRRRSLINYDLHLPHLLIPALPHPSPPPFPFYKSSPVEPKTGERRLRIGPSCSHYELIIQVFPTSVPQGAVKQVHLTAILGALLIVCRCRCSPPPTTTSTQVSGTNTSDRGRR